MGGRESKSDHGTGEPEATADQRTREFEMPSCCGPMAERMMKAIGLASADEAEGREGIQSSGLPDWCKTMMARMMKACAGPRGKDGESPEEKPETCCPGSG